MNTQYITDTEGKKIAVILSMEKYKKMLKKIEDFEDIRLYDEAKKRKQEFIPADEAFRMIEEKRARKNV